MWPAWSAVHAWKKNVSTLLNFAAVFPNLWRCVNVTWHRDGEGYILLWARDGGAGSFMCFCACQSQRACGADRERAAHAPVSQAREKEEFEAGWAFVLAGICIQF